MSSIKEHYSYKIKEKTYSHNISPLYPLKSISKKTNIFELMAQAKLEKKSQKKSILKFFSIFASVASSVVLFYSLY